MKKIVFILSLIITHFGFAQITDTGDRVGVGTTNPSEKLEVVGNIKAIGSNRNISIVGTGTGDYNGASLRLTASGVSPGNEHVSTLFIMHRGTDGTANVELQRRNSSNAYGGSLMLYRDDYGWDFRTASSITGTGTGTKLSIKSSGNVGVGTTTPSEKLHVSGNILGNKLLLNDPNDASDWNTIWQSGFYQSYNAANAPEPNGWFWGLNMNHGSNNSGYRYSGQIAIKNSPTYPVMYFRSTNSAGIGNWTKILHSKGSQTIDGNLGIGTTNTKGFKLGVQGKIAAEEVKVATYTNWADFVFDNDYNLPTLEEVEQHIKVNGHLKDIPSAEEVKKEGFFLGEMDSRLLQKIEELTLYTIEQQKEIEIQNNKMKKLEKENKVLKSLLERVTKLEQQLNKIEQE